MANSIMSGSRRKFLGQVTLSVGGLAVAGLAPASLLEATGSCAAATGAFSDPCGDWTLDDMCIAYPPYAFDSGAAVPHSRPVVAGREGADWHWLT